MIEIIPQLTEQTSTREAIQVNIVQSGSPMPFQAGSVPTPPRSPRKINDPGAIVTSTQHIRFDVEWESIFASRRLLPYSTEPTTTIPIVEFEKRPITFVQGGPIKPFGGPPLAFDVIANHDNDEWVRLENKVLIRILEVTPLLDQTSQVSTFERGVAVF